ncbi:MAG: preprotein translocase subunit SecE [Chloroflexota bacterium]
MSESNSETAVKQPNVIVRYYRETRGELRKVTWPTREESWRLTGIVLASTLVFSLFLWVFDTIFSNGIQQLLSLFIGA